MAIMRVHEFDLGRLCTAQEVSNFITSTTGVMQRYPHSLILFGICIDELVSFSPRAYPFRGCMPSSPIFDIHLPHC
jgi:hypothetical protein